MKSSVKNFVDSNAEKLEAAAVFLLKFNLLAIPMYLVIFSGLQLYPLQLFLTDVVYSILKLSGYPVARLDASSASFVISSSNASDSVNILMDMDCTAWKSMYAFAALVLATPVPNDRRKLRFLSVGVAAIFLLNVVRIVTTVAAAYSFGFQYLEIVHTVLWREGMILAVIAMWFWWIKRQEKKQKLIFREKQTILRTRKRNS